MVLSLAAGWEFRRQRANGAWVRGRGVDGVETVDLPHCWNGQDEFREGVAYYRGPGAYRRRVTVPPLPEDAGAWILESGGFYGTGAVWIDGKKVSDVAGEYLGFRLDISRWLAPRGDNLLAIGLTNRCPSHVLPGIRMPDFLLYGGLAGDLRLIRRPPVYVVPDSMNVGCDHPLDARPVVRWQAELGNGSAASRRVSVRYAVLGPDGRSVAEADGAAIELPAGADGVSVGGDVPIVSPSTWSPDAPNLYRLRLDVSEDGVCRDRVECRFGLRSARFEPDRGFFLNGQRLPLRGLNRHENMPGFGNAMPPGLHREDAERMKALGANFVRLSHYPASSS